MTKLRSLGLVLASATVLVVMLSACEQPVLTPTPSPTPTPIPTSMHIPSPTPAIATPAVRPTSSPSSAPTSESKSTGSPTPTFAPSVSLIPQSQGLYLAYWHPDDTRLYAYPSLDFALSVVKHPNLYIIDLGRNEVVPLVLANYPDHVVISPDRGYILLGGAQETEWMIINLKTTTIETYVVCCGKGDWVIESVATKERVPVQKPDSGTKVEGAALGLNGKSIVFSLSGSDSWSASLWLLDLAQAQWKRLTESANYNELPVLSPEGKKVVFWSRLFVQGSPTGPSGLRVLDVSSGKTGTLRIPEGTQSVSGIVWGASGQYLLYAAEVAQTKGGWNLYISRSDGTSCKQLTSDPGAEFNASWSKNGARVAYLVEDPSGIRKLALVDIGRKAPPNLPVGLSAPLEAAPLINASGNAVAYVTDGGIAIVKVVPPGNEGFALMEQLPDCG